MRSRSFFPYIICVCCLLSSLLVAGTYSPALAQIKAFSWRQASAAPYSERMALVILPGLGDSGKGRRHQARFFQDRGYDVFIPDFHDRQSVEGSVRNFAVFYYEEALHRYKEVHVFSYILGSWVLNTYLAEHPDHNITRIVYDRSPLQERAPAIMVKRMPRISRWIVGPLLEDFSQTPYPALSTEHVKIGLMIENRATPLIKLFKRTALAMGPVNFQAESLGQAHHDKVYVWLHHGQMYHRFDLMGEEILHFFDTGQFSSQARRHPYPDNPFRAKRAADDIPAPASAPAKTLARHP